MSDSKCDACGLAINGGDLVRFYDDIGEAHVDCDDPTGARFQNTDRIPADPDEYDDPSDVPTFIRTHRAVFPSSTDSGRAE